MATNVPSTRTEQDRAEELGRALRPLGLVARGAGSRFARVAEARRAELRAR